MRYHILHKKHFFHFFRSLNSTEQLRNHSFTHKSEHSTHSPLATVKWHFYMCRNLQVNLFHLFIHTFCASFWIIVMSCEDRSSFPQRQSEKILVFNNLLTIFCIGDIIITNFARLHENGGSICTNYPNNDSKIDWSWVSWYVFGCC